MCCRYDRRTARGIEESLKQPRLPLGGRNSDGSTLTRARAIPLQQRGRGETRQAGWGACCYKDNRVAAGRERKSRAARVGASTVEGMVRLARRPAWGLKSHSKDILLGEGEAWRLA